MDKEKQKQAITEIMNEDAKDGLYKQQTAVEWFSDELARIIPQFKKAWYGEILKAKQMEREQIEAAYKAGFEDMLFTKDSPSDYYTQTYGE